MSNHENYILDSMKNFDQRFPTLDKDIQDILKHGYCEVDGCITNMTKTQIMEYIVRTSEDINDVYRRYAQIYLMDQDQISDTDREYLKFGLKCFIHGIGTLAGRLGIKI